jgi:hypothetical protein
MHRPDLEKVAGVRLGLPRPDLEKEGGVRLGLPRPDLQYRRMVMVTVL